MKGNSMVFTMVLPPILGGVLMLHQPIRKSYKSSGDIHL